MIAGFAATVTRRPEAGKYTVMTEICQKV